MKKTASVSALLKRPRRCVCGKCGSCVENDRWERIFQAKYGQQERDYYAERRQPRSGGVSAKALAESSIYAYAEEGQTTAGKGSTDTSQSLMNFLRAASRADQAA